MDASGFQGLLPCRIVQAVLQLRLDHQFLQACLLPTILDNSPCLAGASSTMRSLPVITTRLESSRAGKTSASSCCKACSQLPQSCTSAWPCKSRSTRRSSADCVEDNRAGAAPPYSQTLFMGRSPRLSRASLTGWLNHRLCNECTSRRYARPATTCEHQSFTDVILTTAGLPKRG